MENWLVSIEQSRHILYKFTSSHLVTSLLTAIMGNSLKPVEPDQTSDAVLIKDLMDIITCLTQELDHKSRNLEMYHSQAHGFLQQVENRDREIAVLKGELQRNILKLKRVHFSD